MKQSSFLARHTLGLPNYLLIAMAAAFVIALAPRGAFKAVQSNSNNLDAWLPAGHKEVVDLNWFREQFDGDQFVLVSWDGCTLAEAGKLQRVARKLAPAPGAGEAAGAKPPAAADLRRAEDPLFTRVATGPEIVEQLTAAPYSLPYDVAVARLEGSIVGSATSGARTTCLAAYLSPWASENETVRRRAIDQIREVVSAEAHIDPATIRMVGPGIDSIAIDDASLSTLARLGSVAVIAGLALGTWRLKSFGLAAMVTAVSVINAAASLAIVFYFGIFEVLSLGRVAPLLGRADALVLAVPAAVYLLSMLVTLRMIYYYRDARLNPASHGAAERAVAVGRPMWGITALLIAAVLGVLCLSDLLPARQFGLFAGLGVLVSVGIAVALVPVMLHRFPPKDDVIAMLAGDKGLATPPTWLNGLFEGGMAGRMFVLVLAIAAFIAAGMGIARLDGSSRLPALASGQSDLMRDYAWFEQHVGSAVPMEVVLTVPIERCREPDEPAEADGQQYRLTLEERMGLMSDLEQGLRTLPQVSGVLSAATATPADATLADAGDAVREAFERHGYVRVERHEGSDRPTGRELWRVSARVAASTPGHADVDYAEVTDRVRTAVTPVLLAYEQRDWLVRQLHQSGKELAGAKISILFRAANEQAAPAKGSQELLLADLLRRSGVANGDVDFVNLSMLETTSGVAQGMREQIASNLAAQDAAVLTTAFQADPVVEQLVARGVNVADVAKLPGVEESQAVPLEEAGGPRPIRAVYTGMPPIATAVQGELMATLRESAIAIPALVVVMMFVAWNAVGGLLATLAILFPAAVVLGVLGWTGVDIDMGILLIAGVALGVALDATVSFVAWLRRGADAGLFRTEAARMAYCRVAPGMLDATLIGGLGLLAMAASGITISQQFGLAAIGVMAAAMAGSLVVLPAMAASPLGRFFGAEAAPADGALTLAPVKVDVPRVAEPAARPGRADVAAAAGPGAPHRAKPGVTADDRQEVAEGPHSALHAKLQRLRRSGDSPAP
ncbi:MAG: hypothetical protein H0T51_18015 [Pirellulales bacterium]|nr:hypothetical protein [Pirellulales bacterium]